MTSPNGEVIDGAAADCPYGQEAIGYTVMWNQYLYSNALQIGANYISVEACNQYYQCSQVTGAINYQPPIDSVRVYGPGESVVVPLGTIDTTFILLENFHPSLSYEYNDVNVECLSGLALCEIIGSSTISLSNPGGFDTLFVKVRGDSVGPRAFNVNFCRGFNICVPASQTVAVMPPTPVAAAVTVTPGVDTANHGLSAAASLSFTVKNTGSTPMSFALGAYCDPLVIASGCSVPSNTATLSPNASTLITMANLVTASPTGVRTGAVQLTARAGGATATGQTAVTISSSGGQGGVAGIELIIAGLNPSESVARDQCLMLPIDAASGFECGDLRVVHPLPVLTTMSVTRGTALTHLGRHGEGIPLLYANVRTVHSAPSTVTAKLRLPNGLQSVRTFSWGAGCKNQYCRIAIPVRSDTGGALSTGWHHFELNVEMTDGDSTLTATDTGSVAVVNREESPFGRGWWLQGFEEVVHFEDSTRKLWVGGDGSTRLYKKTSLGSNTFLSTSPLSRPDTLVRVDSTDWRRRLPNGAYVKFDNLGRQVETVNAQGHVTTWKYSATGKLDSILLPKISGTVRPHYRFIYSQSGGAYALDSVQTRSDVTNPPRTTKVTRTGFRVTSIKDPGDTAAVRFGTNTTTGRIEVRRNRLGDSTYYSYDSLGGLSQSKRSLSRTGGDAIESRYCAAETRSLVSCSWGPTSSVGGVPVPQAVTRVDGPRAGLIDVATFHVNRFGAPDTIQDPLGNLTRIERHGTFPALVSKVVDPLGRTQQAWYNSRGLVDSMRSPGPNGSVFATTRIRWNSKWALPDTIKPPQGASIRFNNATDYARVNWRQVGPHDSTRVTFYTNAAYQRLDSIRQPGSMERYSYDATLGNISRVQSGVSVTKIYRDRWGADSVTQDHDTSPLIKTTTYRDARGRVDSVRSVSTAVTDTIESTSTPFTVSSRTRVVRNTYDLEGNILSVNRSDAASSAQSATTHWTYDAAGRVTTRRDSIPRDSFFYDPAGNEIRKRTARGHSILQYYDAAGRLAGRVIPEVTYLSEDCADCTGLVMLYKPISFPYYHTVLPGSGRTQAMVLQGDVELFTYDAAGRMLSANNRNAQVSRSYAPNGAITQEVQRIRTYDPTEEISSNPFSQHVFTTNYVGDVSGRRISRSDWLNRTQTYTYHDSLGVLIRVADRSTGGGDSTATHFTWTASGALLGRSVGGIMSEVRTYDAHGRLATRDNSVGFEDAYTYDARGKQKTRYSLASAQFLADSSTMWYDGFGAVVAVDRHRILGGQDNTVDEFLTDALGNVIMSDQNRSMTVNRSRGQKSFEGERVKLAYSVPLTTLRDPAQHTRPLIKSLDSTWYLYDAGGNQRSTRTRRLIYADSTIVTSGGKGGYTYQDIWKEPASPYTVTRSFYDAANRLRVYEQNNHAYGPWHTVQEYRYDALGRRVLLRTRRDSTTCNSAGASENSPACLSTIERFVWDGDQLVTEYRRPGRWNLSAAALDSLTSATSAFFGIVRYVHALGIDDPILVEKLGASGGAFIPHRSGRGGFEAGTYVSSGTDMTAYTWPARYEGIYPGNDARLEAPADISWYGSLLDGKADLSGLIYMRNRYFDPGTGRFTQPDPIGLAGGLNLYGYGDGDPVSNHDPFGLKVCFRGSDKSIQHKKAATERATGTTFKLDDQNCVYDVVATGPVQGNAVDFDRMARDPNYTVYIGYRWIGHTKSDWESRGIGGIANVLINRFTANGGRYWTHDANGQCVRNGSTAFNYESMIAHELGHLYSSIYMSGVQSDAFVWENNVYAAQGQPKRFNCGDHKP